MLPALAPGDFLMVRPPRRRVAPGDVVTVPDPRTPSREIIKRVAAVLDDGTLFAVGDNSIASTDSRTFGALQASLVTGRAWLIYWPPRRIRLIRHHHAASYGFVTPTFSP